MNEPQKLEESVAAGNLPIQPAATPPNQSAPPKLDYALPEYPPDDALRYVQLFLRLSAVSSIGLIRFLGWSDFMYELWQFRTGAPGH